MKTLAISISFVLILVVPAPAATRDDLKKYEK